MTKKRRQKFWSRRKLFQDFLSENKFPQNFGPPIFVTQTFAPPPNIYDKSRPVFQDKIFCSHRSSSSGSLPCLLKCMQVQMYASIANPLVRCWVSSFSFLQLSANIQSSIICLGFFALFPSIFP